jgi:hypothetical protein
MIPVLEIAAMLFGTLTLLFITLLITIASFIFCARFPSWRTLFMAIGASLSLIARTAITAVGYLEMARVVSNFFYHKVNGLAYALGTAGNLIFAIGFLALAMHFFKKMAPMAKSDSVPL